MNVAIHLDINYRNFFIKLFNKSELNIESIYKLLLIRKLNKDQLKFILNMVTNFIGNTYSWINVYDISIKCVKKL